MQTVVNYSPTMRVCAIDPNNDVYGVEVWDDNRKRWRPSMVVTMLAAQMLTRFFDG